MQKRDAKKLCSMLSVTAMMLFAGFGMRDDSKGELTSMHASAIALTDVRRGEVFLLGEQPRSMLMIDVTKAGDVLVSDVAMTKAKLFSEIEKRIRRYGDDFPVMIAVDKDTQYKDVAKVMDLCAKASVRGEVSFLGMRSRRLGIHSTLRVGLPRTDNRQPQGAAEQEVSIKIQIGPDKQNVVLNQRNGNKHIPFDRLDQHVKGLAGRAKDATVLLACTPDAPHENLMRVLDICQECKMTCRLTEQLLEKASVEEFLPIFKIQIGADTKCVVVNGRGISFKDLDCYIKKLSEEATETIVFLSCTQDSPHGSLVRVLDICYKYKMYKLAIFSVGSNERDNRDERKGGEFLWGWPRKTSSLLRNPDIELEVGKYGIVLTPEEQRAPQLVIDVDRHGDCWVANRRINLGQLSILVKDRYLEYLDFPCMVRADRNARHGHVHEAFSAFLRGQNEACMQNPKVSAAEPKISIVALAESHEDEDVYSRLDVYFPCPSQNPADGSGPWWANVCEVEEANERDENEPPPDVIPPPEDVEVPMDSPSISPVEAAEVAPPTAEPQSLKVASVDAMLLNIKSPVMMKSVASTNAHNVGVRGRYMGGGAQYGDPRYRPTTGLDASKVEGKKNGTSVGLDL